MSWGVRCPFIGTGNPPKRWFYDELSPGGPVVAVNIPISQWHTVRALEFGTVIMEVKDGPYEPTGEEDILAL